MKRLLLAVGFLLFAGQAFAAMNLQQQGDGTAEWRGREGTTGNCVGGHLLHFTLPIVHSATDYAVSPISNAIIRNAWMARPATTSGTSGRVTFRVGYQGTLTPVRFVDRSAATASIAYIVVDAGAVGTSERISSLTEAGADDLDLGNSTGAIGLGDTISASSDGGGTLSSPISSKVLVLLCPR